MSGIMYVDSESKPLGLLDSSYSTAPESYETLVAELHAHPHAITILATGPLTNLADAERTCLWCIKHVIRFNQTRFCLLYMLLVFLCFSLPIFTFIVYRVFCVHHICCRCFVASQARVPACFS